MTYKAIDIAAEFIRLGIENNNKLTHMQVQKLTYIANGFYLAIEDQQLFTDNIKAWKYGPVIPVLYDALRHNGNDLITEPPKGSGLVDKLSNQFAMIQAVYFQYSDMPGWKLSALTHQKNTPWSQTWEAMPLGLITPDVIREHYREMIER